jgi:hypothetical protein
MFENKYLYSVLDQSLFDQRVLTTYAIMPIPKKVSS